MSGRPAVGDRPWRRPKASRWRCSASVAGQGDRAVPHVRAGLRAGNRGIASTSSAKVTSQPRPRGPCRRGIRGLSWSRRRIRSCALAACDSRAARTGRKGSLPRGRPCRATGRGGRVESLVVVDHPLEIEAGNASVRARDPMLARSAGSAISRASASTVLRRRCGRSRSRLADHVAVADDVGRYCRQPAICASISATGMPSHRDGEGRCRGGSSLERFGPGFPSVTSTPASCSRRASSASPPPTHRSACCRWRASVQLGEQCRIARVGYASDDADAHEGIVALGARNDRLDVDRVLDQGDAARPQVLAHQRLLARRAGHHGAAEARRPTDAAEQARARGEKSSCRNGRPRGE